jgi:hypothetical protein
MLTEPKTVNFLSIVAEHALMIKLSKELTTMGYANVGTEVHREHTSDLFYTIETLVLFIFSFLRSLHIWRPVRN